MLVPWKISVACSQNVFTWEQFKEVIFLLSQYCIFVLQHIKNITYSVCQPLTVWSQGQVWWQPGVEERWKGYFHVGENKGHCQGINWFSSHLDQLSRGPFELFSYQLNNSQTTESVYIRANKVLSFMNSMSVWLQLMVESGVQTRELSLNHIFKKK